MELWKYTNPEMTKLNKEIAASQKNIEEMEAESIELANGIKESIVTNKQSEFKDLKQRFRDNKDETEFEKAKMEILTKQKVKLASEIAPDVENEVQASIKRFRPLYADQVKIVKQLRDEHRDAIIKLDHMEAYAKSNILSNLRQKRSSYGITEKSRSAEYGISFGFTKPLFNPHGYAETKDVLAYDAIDMREEITKAERRR